MNEVKYLKDIENKELRHCIKEMLRRVGVKGEAAEAFEFKGDWFKTHEWTREEEQSFRAWLYKRWRTVRSAYMSLWRYRPRVAQVKAEISWFDLMWGWTRKKVEE